MDHLTVDDPATGETACKLPLASAEEAHECARRARRAARAFAETTIDERIELCERFISVLGESTEAIALDITRQMGKPIREARAEVATTVERTRAAIELAPQVLAPERLGPRGGIEREIEHLPLGVVLDIAAWNYPLLTAVNVVVPALLAGNAVILKHSSRTPLCAGHFARAFAEAGAPTDLVSALIADHQVTAELIGDEEIAYVAFTGSVAGGRAISTAASGRFIDIGLELGGKDPAYVRADADVEAAAEAIADGAFYNAGQSCCAVERIYVDRKIHDRFVAAVIEEARRRPPADPRGEDCRLGAIAQPGQPEFIARQVEDAVGLGARLEIGGRPATFDGCGRYFECTVLTGVTQDMDLMREETFGPVAPIAVVDGDEQAIERMNDSRYGLTASIWTRDVDSAHRLASRIEAGTVFLNRCDYVDPYLPWAGWKDSGVGMTLSRHGLLRLTRTRARHFRRPG